MFQEMQVASGGGGGGGNSYYSDFTPTLNVTSEFDVGFSPTKVFVWNMYASRTISVLEYDVSTGTTYQWYDTYTHITDSYFQDWFGIQGTTVKYTPKNSNYIAKTWIVVI